MAEMYTIRSQNTYVLLYVLSVLASIVSEFDYTICAPQSSVRRVPSPSALNTTVLQTVLTLGSMLKPPGCKRSTPASTMRGGRFGRGGTDEVNHARLCRSIGERRVCTGTVKMAPCSHAAAWPKFDEAFRTTITSKSRASYPSVTRLQKYEKLFDRAYDIRNRDQSAMFDVSRTGLEEHPARFPYTGFGYTIMNRKEWRQRRKCRYH